MSDPDDELDDDVEELLAYFMALTGLSREECAEMLVDLADDEDEESN